MTAAILAETSAFDWANFTATTIVGVLGLIVGGAGVWFSGRRTPPLPEEVAKQYLSLAAFSEHKAERDKQLTADRENVNGDLLALTKRVVAAEASIHQLAKDHERALGNIEGQLNGINTSFAALSKSHEKCLESAIEALKTALEAKAGSQRYLPPQP